MDKTEKYNIASMDIHGHGCDVTELKHVLPPEEFAIETASLFGLLSDSTRRSGKEGHYTIADTADGELVSDLLKTVFERRGIYEEDL